MEGELKRQLGVPAAVLLGLGSIIGTGVFVSVGIAAGITGPTVVWAVAVAGVVAAANGLSSAQLAAAYPVSGGTYVYAGRLLTPRWGFVAGWMFLCAKSASAATAALGFAGYLIALTGWSFDLHRWIALGLVAAVGAIVLRGIRRSAVVNAVLVAGVLAALASFVVYGAPHVATSVFTTSGFETTSWLEATAIMFVAYTGYGRIATLGEEVRRPRRTIPLAIILTMVVTIAIYVSVTVVAVGTVGPAVLAAATESTAAPLAVAAASFAPAIEQIIEIAAVVAMAGVLLNLVLGLSRVVLAMGRGRDLPRSLASVDASGTTPVPATLLVLVIVAGLTLVGDLRTTWTFSAVTVLIYYTLTNISALRLADTDRRFPRWIAVAGAGACLGLALFVEPLVWLAAGLLLLLGFASRRLVRERSGTVR